VSVKCRRLVQKLLSATQTYVAYIITDCSTCTTKSSGREQPDANWQ